MHDSSGKVFLPTTAMSKLLPIAKTRSKADLVELLEIDQGTFSLMLVITTPPPLTFETTTCLSSLIKCK